MEDITHFLLDMEDSGQQRYIPLQISFIAACCWGIVRCEKEYDCFFSFPFASF